MSEHHFMHRCLLRLSRVATVFRHNVGQAWLGRTKRVPGGVFITQAQPVRFGLCEGGADIIGWLPITIQPEHVGQQVAVFLAVETKGPRTLTTQAQVNFLEQVSAAGGIAMLARREDDITGFLGKVAEGQRVWGCVHGTLPSARRPGKQP